MTTTHSFAGPHLWPAPKPGEADIVRPGHSARTPEEIAKCAALLDAYLNALERACKQALGSMQGAVVGYSTGICAVTASRNIWTREGWWQGTDSEQPCDKTLTLLRVEALDGKPIAALFDYGIRSCVMNRIKDPDGGTLISSDVCGGACTYLEREFGGDFTALFLCGAACDQEPMLKGNFTELDKDGEICKGTLGLGAEVLLEAQSIRLGADVLKVWRGIDDLQDVSRINMGSAACVCETKKMNGNLSALKPSCGFAFEPNGEMELTAYALTLGGFSLIGLQPEMGGVTSTQIRQAFPDEVVAMAIMVNGGGKCMPDEEAYTSFKYQSQNTPFMPGQAEKLRDTAIKLLKELKEVE